jgi:hypothetical protein
MKGEPMNASSWFSSTTRRRSVAFSAMLVLAALGSTSARGQEQTQQRMAAIKESLAANQAALKTYGWVETTQISLKGEVKKTDVKNCHYGADGKVQKTEVPGGAAPPAAAPASGRGRRGGGLAKKAIVENKKEETKEYMEKVSALVHEYVPPEPPKLQAAQAAGTLSVQPGPNATMTVTNYVKPGDSLAIGMDAAAKQITSYKVTSYVDDPKDDAISLTVTFARLEDGTNYPQRIVLDVAAKKLQVTVTNSGYKKAAP